MKRYPELDLLRTLAILGMILYHTLFDLFAFYGFDIDVLHGGWRLFARCTAILFLLLVGISFTISWDRSPLYKKQLMRAAKILACALLITVVTFIAVKEQYVRFGILHLIGTSALLLPFFAPLRIWNLLIGFIILFLGTFVPPPSFATIDYFHPVPWLGVILVGMGVGYWLYVPHVRLGNFSMLGDARVARLYGPGRHSLLMYMIHQPIIIGILWIIFGRPSF